MKLIIGNKNYSSWSMRPWVLMRHFAIDFEEIRIPLSTANSDSELAQYTDANKVPVLHDSEVIVWDSLAICEYINEQYLHGKGWPDDVKTRAQCRSACAEMHSSFTHIREFMPLNCRARRRVDFTPEMLSEIRRVDDLWQELRKEYAERGDWLLGTFTIADCFYAPMASRFRTYMAEISPISQAYVEQILNHQDVSDWHRQAAAENEIIDWAEVGEDA